ILVQGTGDGVARTLSTLQPAYQRGVPPDFCEILVADPGGGGADSDGAPAADLDRTDHRTPAAALNHVARLAKGKMLLILTGPRLLSPGVMRFVAEAMRAAEDPVVAFHDFDLASPRRGPAEGTDDPPFPDDEWLRSI